MHFRHPELLYALFLLVIPILVHLFQLRRFRPEKFTNVRFLRKAVLQTRKSSQLKKWLVLFTRLIALAAIIIAFAQPYLPPASGEIVSRETVIYLDNSYSMQAKGQKGVLLKRGVQDLLEGLPEEGRAAFFTNDEEYRDISLSSLRKKLQQISFSPGQLEWNTVRLKAEGMFSDSPRTRKDFIAVSDFQQVSRVDSISGVNIYPVILQAPDSDNIVLDSVFVSGKSLDAIELTVQLAASGDPGEVSVGIYNGNDLLTRKMTAFTGSEKTEVVFELPPRGIEQGVVRIEDKGLNFDNELFFNLDETPPVEVVVVNNADVSFLKRIFRSPDFNLTVFPEENIDYSYFSEADLVILNGVEHFSVPLLRTLSTLQEENAHLIIIPSEDADLQTYNSFFRSQGLPAFDQLVNEQRLVTDISFDHPLFRTVFNERVENFQYPTVQKYFPPVGNPDPVLKFENGQAFLYEKENIFVFTAPLAQENTNFKNSPLVVPTFYNIGNLAVSPGKLYYVLGLADKADIRIELEKDEILKLQGQEEILIPRQQAFQNKISMYFEDTPGREGHFRVMRDSEQVKTLSFNISRNESKPALSPETPAGIQLRNNLPAVLSEIEAATMPTALWKWFVIFGLVFLLFEMLILKLLK